MFGLDLGTPPCASRRPEPRRVAALEAALLPALSRSPCVVRSPAATRRSARDRHGRGQAGGPPVPGRASFHFPESPAAEETEWQELVVGHLGLDTWVRREITDELDFVGPLAQRAMLRHGLLWPANMHFVAAVAREATGGAW